MIEDSVPWRQELSRIADRLERRSAQKRWSDRAAFEVERDLMVGMFAIRRLIESEKSSSRLPEKKIPVAVCRLTGREPSPLDSWRPWEFYDTESTQHSELPLSKLVHEFIHSFTLTVSAEDGQPVTGVLVASDRTKKRHVYSVSMAELVALFRYVGTEDVVSFRGSLRSGVYESERISNHDMEEGPTPDWQVDDMTSAIHEALIHMLGSPNCPKCLTPMEPVGAFERERWECPECGAVKLA